MRRLRMGLLASTVTLACALAATGGGGAWGAAGAAGSGSLSNIHFVYPAGHQFAGAATPGPNDLLYGGGPVEAAGSTNYAIFWEPSLFSVSSTYNSLITRFFNDIGGSSLYGVSAQYYQQSGVTQQFITNSSTLGASWVDTTLYPAPVLTDADIQAEVTKAMAVNHWTGGVGHEFFVFTAKNEVSCAGVECSFAVFCAYHGSFVAGGQNILYADQPYTGTTPTGCNTPSSPNGDSDADSTINVVSHELMETVTDPLPAANKAWQDASGSEIGDKCNFTFGPTDSGGADLRVNGHGYIVQQEWSNNVHGCSMS